jgi:mRNA m6A methyltransferase catalytic subunit
MACRRVHFRKLIYPWTDPALGNCSYLNTCRNIRNCKWVLLVCLYAQFPQ